MFTAPFEFSWFPSPRRWTLEVCAIVLVVFPLFPAEQCRAADTEQQFKGLLEKHSKATFNAIADYVTEHPDAADVEQAYVWLLDNSVKLHLEGEAVRVADAILKRPTVDPAIRGLAQQVRALGLVQLGRIPEALEVLGTQLGASRFRAANATVEFGLMLATQVQLKGDIPAAREIYERLAESFPLSQDIRELTNRKLARLELIGKPAPPIRIKDLEGKDVDLGEYAGKVVLVDFWGTFCAPCLAEFPNLKRIYGEYQARGFEIVGISLDEDTATVDAFQQRYKLPWRIALEDPANPIGKAYGVPTIPALFLLDQKGNVVHVDLKGDELEHAVKRLLEKSKE